jgi:hypothetical protein
MAGIYYNAGSSDSNLTFSNNTISRCNWGIAPSSATTGDNYNGVIISGNIITNTVNWDDTSDAFHHNGIIAFNGSGTPTMAGLQIYNNYIGGDLGVNQTAYIFLDLNGGSMPSPLIFNNVLENTSSHHPTNGYITGCGSSGGQIYNNTVLGNSTPEGSGAFAVGTGCTVYNNIVVATERGIVAGSGGAPTSNHNVFYNLTCAGGTGCFAVGSNYYGSLSAWNTATRQDGNSSSGNPQLNTSYIPLTGSVAFGLGANLTGLGITALDSDKAGTARPSTGVWTAGAYNSGSSLGNSSPSVSFGASSVAGR